MLSHSLQNTDVTDAGGKKMLTDTTCQKMKRYKWVKCFRL